MNTPLMKAFAAIDAATSAESEVAAATAKGLMIGYDHRWGLLHTNIEVLEMETVYRADLTNLDSQRTSRTFRLAGKVDKLTQERDGRVLYDHKTTSQDIQDPNSPYWRQLVIEGQPSQYEILLLANGVKVNRVVWDVVRKPGIRPKKLTKAERASIVSTGAYCGTRVSSESRDLMQTQESENGELYQARLALECTENHERYFARRSVPRTRQELYDYNQELWDIAKEIQAAKVNDRHFRNSGACMLYGSPCLFLGICSGHDTADSDRWIQRESVHGELDESVGDGRGYITNSRVRCFQTCRRKHFYQYELGIERADAEEKEALFFGTLWHLALDAWWACVQTERNHVYDEFPADATGNFGADAATEFPLGNYDRC